MVLLNANQGEVNESNLAVARAQSEAVRSYAQTLVMMHTQAQVRENALFADAKLTPTTSPVATQLMNTSATLVADLQAATAADFDALFLRRELEAHQRLLDLIDISLSPAAMNAGLRTELTNLRSEVELHITQGRQVADGLDIETDAGVP